jgi:hypothetical protein
MRAGLEIGLDFETPMGIHFPAIKKPRTKNAKSQYHSGEALMNRIRLEAMWRRQP